jgi:hypothetical protein
MVIAYSPRVFSSSFLSMRCGGEGNAGRRLHKFLEDEGKPS